MEPVGDGAMRVTTGLRSEEGEDIGLPDEGSSTVRRGAWAAGLDWAGGLSTRRLSVPSAASVWAFLKAEVAAQADRAFTWAPVAYGAGCALYLGLKVEPAFWPLAGMAAALVAVAMVVRRYSGHRGITILAILLAVAACGLAAAKLRSDVAAAPIVPPKLGVVTVEGFVVDVANPSQTGQRLLIAPTWVSGLSPRQTPKRVRVVIPNGTVIGPGGAVRVTTLLDPPPAPAAPGAYDFARDAWFDGIGGVGLAMKPPAMIDLPTPPLRLRIVLAINEARWTMAQHLAADLHVLMGDDDGGATGLAVTVATSHEDWLDEQSRDDLRASGLAHMLAIAGLHMAAVSGFVFFGLRLGIAAWPWLALRVNGKKLAALGGLAAVIAYLILSGAHPPARRAAITASVAFAAILFDRRVVSMHSLAIAALAVLALEPEVVTAPGFEMSFCATASLVALAEIWPRAQRAVGLPWWLNALQTGRDWLVAMIMVSFVAGMATSPFSIQHFNRIAVWGVFANLTADFVASAVMMPALAISLVLEALGAAHAIIAGPLWVTGWAARTIVSLAHVFAGGPIASASLPSAPTIALAISYIGIVFACLWRGPLRWIGVPMAAAVALWPRPAPPIAWIAADGNDAAIVQSRAEVALKPGKRAYATQLWAQRWGFNILTDESATSAQQAAFDCDRKHCAPLAGAHPALAAWWTVRAPKANELADLCRSAEILVLRANVDPPPECAKTAVLTGADFAAGGSAEVYEASGGYRLKWAQSLRGERPWSRYSGGG
jgi:competence protein ComEC